MKCMCAQTRPRFILSSERVFGGMEFEPMLTPREKSPLPENVPRGGSNPRRCGQWAQALPTELFRPPAHATWAYMLETVCGAVKRLQKSWIAPFNVTIIIITGGGKTSCRYTWPYLFGSRMISMLGVLLILRVEVVNGILHDVTRVHCLLQGGWNALQRDGATVASRRTWTVDTVGEGKAQGDGSYKHLQADEEILPASWHCAHTHLGLPVLHEDRGDHPRLFQDGQDYPCGGTMMTS